MFPQSLPTHTRPRAHTHWPMQIILFGTNKMLFGTRVIPGAPQLSFKTNPEEHTHWTWLHDKLSHKLQPLTSSNLSAPQPVSYSPSHGSELQPVLCGCVWLTGRPPGGGAIVTQGSQRRATELSHPRRHSSHTHTHRAEWSVMVSQNLVESFTGLFTLEGSGTGM